jgi:ribosomal protein L11 methylase PrmA
VILSWLFPAIALAQAQPQVGEKDFFIDLGSGDGIVVIAAAKRGAR